MSNSPDSRPGIAPSNLRAQERSGPFHRPSRRQIEAAAALALGIGVSAGLSGGVSHRNVEAQGPDSTSTPAPTYAIDPLAHPTEQLNKRIEFPALINGISEYKSVPTARATRVPVTNTPPIETAKPDPTATNIPATPTEEASATPEVKEKVVIPARVPVFIDRPINPNIHNSLQEGSYTMIHPQYVRTRSGQIVAVVDVGTPGVLIGALVADLGAIPDNLETFTGKFPPYKITVVGPNEQPLWILNNTPSNRTETAQALNPDMSADQEPPTRRPAHVGARPYPWNLRGNLPQLREKYGKDLPQDIALRLQEEGVDLETDTVDASTPVYILGQHRHSTLFVGNLETDGSVTWTQNLQANGEFYYDISLSNDGADGKTPQTPLMSTGWGLQIYPDGKTTFQAYTMTSPDTSDLIMFPKITLPFLYIPDGKSTLKARLDGKELLITVIRDGEIVGTHRDTLKMAASNFQTVDQVLSSIDLSNAAYLPGASIELDLNAEPLADLTGPDPEKAAHVQRLIDMQAGFPLIRLSRARNIVAQWPDNPSVTFPTHPEVDDWITMYDMTRRRDYMEETLNDPMALAMFVEDEHRAGKGFMWGPDASYDFDRGDGFKNEEPTRKQFEDRLRVQAENVRRAPKLDALQLAIFGASGGIHAGYFKFYGDENKALDAIASRIQGVDPVIAMPESVAFSENSFPENKHSQPFLKWVQTLIALRDRNVNIAHVTIPAGISEETLLKINKALAEVGIQPILGNSFVGNDDLADSFARVNGGYLKLLNDRDPASTRKGRDQAPFLRVEGDACSKPLSPSEKLMRIVREGPYSSSINTPPPSAKQVPTF